jgi:hypothetical protein
MLHAQYRAAAGHGLAQEHRALHRRAAAPTLHHIRAADLGTLARDHCDELDETYDGHTGDGIGGYAGRLRDALTWEIEQDASEWELETI